jgi:ribonuclease HI
MYSVRSAYYQLMENIIDNNHLKENGNWKKLWKLQVPNKVKIFLWRVLRGCLPVRSRLVDKGVRCDNKCPQCASYAENEWHCFFGCTAAQEVWRETIMWQQIDAATMNAIGLVPMLFKMLEELNSDDLSHIVMILWTLWWRRNQKCWQEKFPSVYEVIRRASDTLNDWAKAQQQRKTSSSSNTVMSTYTWLKPPAGALKCNIDTACYKDQNIYCVAACIRDAQGRFVRAYVKRFEGCPEIAEAEAMGVCEALQWMHNSHMSNIHVETDCLQVVQAIKTNSRDCTEFGNIISMCRSLINMNQNCQVSYVRRQANRAAHDLAQATRFFASPQVFNYCPPCIENIIMNEMH